MARKKSRKKSRKSGLSDAGVLNGTLDTLKSFGKLEFWKDAGLGFAGAASYVLVPTAIEAIFKTDLTGWKMPLVGLLGSTVAAAITRRKAVLFGALSAFSAHWMYAKANGAIIKPVFGQYLSRFDAQAVETFADNQPQLQPGATMRQTTLPDGTVVNIPVYPQLNDGYQTSLTDGYSQELSDGYQPSLTDGYSENLSSNYQDSLMDDDDVENLFD